MQNLFTRNDTLFGVCEAIGQDLRFHPNYLRILFAASLLVSATAGIAVYLGLGVIVLATRLIVPARRRQPAVSAGAAVHSDNDADAIEFAEAA